MAGFLRSLRQPLSQSFLPPLQCASLCPGLDVLLDPPRKPCPCLVGGGCRPAASPPAFRMQHCARAGLAVAGGAGAVRHAGFASVAGYRMKVGSDRGGVMARRTKMQDQDPTWCSREMQPLKTSITQMQPCSRAAVRPWLLQVHLCGPGLGPCHRLCSRSWAPY